MGLFGKILDKFEPLHFLLGLFIILLGGGFLIAGIWLDYTGVEWLVCGGIVFVGAGVMLFGWGGNNSAAH